MRLPGLMLAMRLWVLSPEGLYDNLLLGMVRLNILHIVSPGLDKIYDPGVIPCGECIEDPQNWQKKLVCETKYEYIDGVYYMEPIDEKEMYTIQFDEMDELTFKLTNVTLQKCENCETFCTSDEFGCYEVYPNH